MNTKPTQQNTRIEQTDWSTHKTQLADIRRRVFIDEQQVPEAMEWDEYDHDATHFLVTIGGAAIATARVKADGQIGRMAVLAEYRGQGIGSKLLAFVLLSIKKQKPDRLYLHAQVSAISFYEKHGFACCSDIFHEAGIPHREMQLVINSNDVGD